MTQLTICIIIFVISLIMYATNILPMAVTSLLTMMAFVLTGEAKRAAADKQKWSSYEMLLQMRWKLAECHEAEGNIPAAMEALQEQLRLLREEWDLTQGECVDEVNRNIERLKRKRQP